MPRPRRPHTVAEWVKAILSGKRSMSEVPAEKQVAVQFQGIRWAEQVFEIRRKA